ncbi:unnamed protein product, partial [Owenia fusiformis]
GAVIFAIAFLGCCGVMNDNKLAVFLYAVVLSLTVICEATGGVIAVIFKEQLEVELKSFLNDTIYEKYDGDLFTAEPYSLAWDFAHVTFDCCGIYNYTDFYIAQHWNRTYTYQDGNSTVAMVADIPTMCCKIKDKALYPLNVLNLELQNTTCPLYPTAANSWFLTGCYDSVKAWILQNDILLLCVGIGIAFIEIVGITAACCVFFDIKRKNESKVGQGE